MIVCLLGVSTNSVQQKRIVLRSSLRQYPLKSEAFTKPNKIETIGNLHLRRNIALVRPTRGRKYHSPQGTSCDSKAPTQMERSAGRRTLCTAQVSCGAIQPTSPSEWVPPTQKISLGCDPFEPLCVCVSTVQRVCHISRELPSVFWFFAQLQGGSLGRMISHFWLACWKSRKALSKSYVPKFVWHVSHLIFWLWLILKYNKKYNFVRQIMIATKKLQHYENYSFLHHYTTCSTEEHLICNREMNHNQRINNTTKILNCCSRLVQGLAPEE